MKTAGVVTFRPIRPEDEPLLVKFHETLSEESVYHRYFSQLKLDQRIAHERLTRICFNDYDREIALVVERRDPATKQKEIIGVGRLSKARGLNEAEFALLVHPLTRNLRTSSSRPRMASDSNASDSLISFAESRLPSAMARTCSIVAMIFSLSAAWLVATWKIS